MVAFLVGLVATVAVIFVGVLLRRGFDTIYNKLSHEKKRKLVGNITLGGILLVLLVIISPALITLGQFIINFVTIFWAQL